MHTICNIMVLVILNHIDWDGFYFKPDNWLKINAWGRAWFDVFYSVHDDCWSHTDGAMSWKWGVLMTKCQKQKLSTKIVTEGEIVGVSDYESNVIRTRMYLEEYGYVLLPKSSWGLFICLVYPYPLGYHWC